MPPDRRRGDALVGHPRGGARALAQHVEGVPVAPGRVRLRMNDGFIYRAAQHKLPAHNAHGVQQRLTYYRFAAAHNQTPQKIPGVSGFLQPHNPPGQHQAKR